MKFTLIVALLCLSLVPALGEDAPSAKSPAGRVDEAAQSTYGYIKLKDGRELKGDIVETIDGMKIVTPIGAITFPRSEIVSIRYLTPEEKAQLEVKSKQADSPKTNSSAPVKQDNVDKPVKKPEEPSVANEREVLAKLNLARTKPQEFAKLLEEHKNRFDPSKGNIYTTPFGENITTSEGVAAVNEAIAFLKIQKPLSSLSFSTALSRAAKDHVADMGPKAGRGHVGSDNSNLTQRMQRYGTVVFPNGENIGYGRNTAQDFVMKLVIDDGVASRGHRTNIFNPEFKIVGIALGPHKQYEYMCVMDFAQGFSN